MGLPEGMRPREIQNECARLTEVVERCKDPENPNRAGEDQYGTSKCRYDFETQTFIDHDGNRWDTSEYNKLAD